MALDPGVCVLRTPLLLAPPGERDDEEPQTLSARSGDTQREAGGEPQPTGRVLPEERWPTSGTAAMVRFY